MQSRHTFLRALSLVALLIILFACNLPTNHQTGSLQSGAKNAVTNEQVVDPLDFRIQNLPVQELEKEPILHLMQSGDTPTTIEEVHKYPKNMNVRFKHSTLAPVDLPLVTVKGNKPGQINKAKRAYIQSVRQWIKERHQELYAYLGQQTQQKLAAIENEYAVLLQGLEPSSSLYKQIDRQRKQKIQPIQKNHRERMQVLRQRERELRAIIPEKANDIVALANQQQQRFGIAQVIADCRNDDVDCFIKNSIELAAHEASKRGDQLEAQAIRNLIRREPLPPLPAIATLVKDHTYYSLQDPAARKVTPVSQFQQQSEGYLKHPNRADVLAHTVQALTDLGAMGQMKTAPFKITLSKVLDGLDIDLPPNKYPCTPNSECDTLISGVLNLAFDKLPTPLEIIVGAPFSREFNRVFESSKMQANGSVMMTLNPFGIGHDQLASCPPLASCQGDNLYCYVYNAMSCYYPEALTESMQNNLRLTLQGKSLVFTLESPRQCNQNSTHLIDGKNGFGFQGAFNNHSVLMDGLFSINLGIRDSGPLYQQLSSPIKPVLDPPIQIDIASILGVTVNDLINKGATPLSISVPQPKIDEQRNTKLSFYVQNITANLWDLRLNKIGNPPIYEGTCIDANKATWVIDTAPLETALYEVSANYHNIPTPSPTPTTSPTSDPSKLYPHHKAMVVHADYSTFSYLSDKPISSLVNSTFIPVGNGLHTKQLEGGSYYQPTFDEENNLFIIPDPPLVSSIAITALPERNPGADIVAKTVSDMGEKLFQIGGHEKLAADGSLAYTYKHLIRNPEEDSLFSAFNQNNVKSCSARYLQVGAVVNLTNCDFYSNERLRTYNYAENQQYLPALPMLLNIYNNQNQLVKSFPFHAAMGSHTVFQEYWNGVPEIESDGTSTASPPQYGMGEYKVVVELNNELLDYLVPIWQEKFDAVVAYPTLSAASTQASIKVNPTPREVCEQTETLSGAQPIDMAYLNMANNLYPRASMELISLNTSAAYAWLNVTAPDYIGIANAGLPPDLKGPSAIPPEVEAIYRERMQILQLKRSRANELLARIVAAYNNNELNNPIIQADIIALREELKIIIREAYDIGRDGRISIEVARRLLKIVMHASVQSVAIEIAPLFKSGTNLDPMHKTQFETMAHSIEEINRVVYRRLTSPLTSAPYCNSLGSIIPDYRLPMIDYMLGKTHDLYDGLFMIMRDHYQLLLEKPGDHERLFGIANRTRRLIVKTYEIGNNFTEACDTCTSQVRRNQIINNQNYTTRDISTSELTCRLCKMQGDDYKDSLEETKRVLLVRSVFNEFVSRPKVRTTAYSLVEREQQHILTVASSGEDPSNLNIDSLKMKLFNVMRNNGVSLQLENIIVAKEACNLTPSTSIFPSLKTSSCNQNDAEIKVLETLSRYLQQNNLASTTITPRVISDRLTCEYCQEVDLRISYMSPISGHDLIWGSILDIKTPIRSSTEGRLMTGSLLYLGEQLPVNPDRTQEAISIIRNIQSKGGLCQNAGF